MIKLRAVFGIILSLVAAVMPAAMDVAWAQSTINTGVPASDSNLNSLVVRALALAAASDINGIIGMHTATTLGGCPASPVNGEDCLVLGPPVTWYKFYSPSWQPIGTFAPSFIVSAAALPATVVTAAAVAPLGGLPLYAAPTATGTGSCLSSGNACTLATACSFASQIATFLGQAGPVNFANGTYSFTVVGGVATPPGCNVAGNQGGSATQLLSLLGNCSSPSSVIIALSGGANGITGQDHATIGVNCVQFQSSGTGGTGIICRQQAICDYSNVIWATWGTGGAHFSINNASVNLSSASGGCETITANFNIHWNMSAGGQLSAGCATNIPSAVSWTANGNGFLQSVGGYIDLSGWSTTGSGVAGSTGQQAILTGPGYLLTAGAASCNSVLPGTANTCADNIANGFQDNAGDGTTGTGVVVGQMQPTITDPIFTAHTYAGLPGSPTAGQISHIIDGATGNCSDSACTTPGATVSGGGGSIDLLVGWDGAAWHIFRGQAVPSLNNLSGILAAASGGTGVATASAHTFFAGPASGSPAAMAPRVIVGTDLPLPGSSSLGGVESLTCPAAQWINVISSVSGAPSCGGLPNPTASTLGGVESLAVIAHQYLTGISTSGVPSQAQPSFADLDGGTAHTIPIPQGGSTAPNFVGPCTPSQTLVGGGASADPTCGLLNVAPYYLSGNWYLPFGIANVNNGTATTANTIYCFYTYVPQQLTIKALGAYLATGILTDTLQLAIYSHSGGTLTFVDNTGNINAGTAQSASAINGAVGNTTDILKPGILYAFCENSPGAMVLTTLPLSGAASGQGGLIGSATQSAINTTTSNGLEGRSISQTYGTWPGTITESGMSDVTSTIVPLISFQVN